jgi:hypothetical protein
MNQPMQYPPPDSSTMLQQSVPLQQPAHLICPCCQGANIFVSPQPVQRPLGVANALIIVPLILIPIFGWIVLFVFVFSNRTVVVRNATCQQCGYTWSLDPRPRPNPVGLILWAIIGVSIVALLLQGVVIGSLS